jgi:hypothetical protein
MTLPDATQRERVPWLLLLVAVALPLALAVFGGISVWRAYKEDQLMSRAIFEANSIRNGWTAAVSDRPAGTDVLTAGDFKLKLRFIARLPAATSPSSFAHARERADTMLRAYGFKWRNEVWSEASFVTALYRRNDGIYLAVTFARAPDPTDSPSIRLQTFGVRAASPALERVLAGALAETVVTSDP